MTILTIRSSHHIELKTITLFEMDIQISVGWLKGFGIYVPWWNEERVD